MTDSSRTFRSVAGGSVVMVQNLTEIRRADILPAPTGAGARIQSSLKPGSAPPGAEVVPLPVRSLAVDKGLRPQDIEFSGNVAVIKAGRSVLVEVAGRPIHHDYGKTKNSSRDVRVPADLGRRLVDGARNGFIFRAQRGGYLCRSNFRGHWKRACKAAGVPALRVHDARHSRASWLANDPQTPLANVRDRLGHSSLAVTSRYVHVMHADIDPCVAALERCLAA